MKKVLHLIECLYFKMTIFHRNSLYIQTCHPSLVVGVSVSVSKVVFL